MSKEKKRPSLDDLKRIPKLCRLELAMVCVAFPEKEALPEDLMIAMADPNLIAEKVIELREKYLKGKPDYVSRMAE